MAAEKVRLYESQGETSSLVDVEITQQGNLQLSGYDIGKTPNEFFGDVDYEYWLSVPAEHKDKVLLTLLEKVYGGSGTAVCGFSRGAGGEGYSEHVSQQGLSLP